MPKQPSYRGLRAFIETVNSGSAAGAARRLKISPSAVSHLLRELELHLGIRLFVTGPSSPLTEAGRYLQQSVGSSFAAIEQALTELGAPGLRLRISTVSTFARLWLLPRLAGFAELHPEIRISLSSSRQVMPLNAEPFDCAIRWGRGDWPDAPSELLFREVLVIVGAPRRPASIAPVHTEEPRISAMTRAGDWSHFMGDADVGEAPAHLVVEDRAAAVQAAMFGLGVTVIDQNLVSAQMKSGQLERRDTGSFPLDEGFYFVSNRTGPAARTVEAFAAWLLKNSRAALF